MKKWFWIVPLIVLILLIIFGCYSLKDKIITDINPTSGDDCLVALTGYNLVVFYDGQHLGESERYYWFKKIKEWSDIEKIDNSSIITSISEGATYENSSLVILGIDTIAELSKANLTSISTNLFNKYKKDNKEITKETILSEITPYDSHPEYYEIENFFRNDPFTIKNITLDLKTEKIINYSSINDTGLCLSGV